MRNLNPSSIIPNMFFVEKNVFTKIVTAFLWCSRHELVNADGSECGPLSC